MKISYSSDFVARDIKIQLGVIEAHVQVTPSSEELLTYLDEVVANREAELAGQPASSVPQVKETRKAYKALGKDPARYRPAAEALIRRVLQGKGLYRVNNVVDVNNLISVKSGISIGTYIAQAIQGDVTFRRAEAGESYKGIGRGDLNLEGLPVFSDELGPFGCPTSDSERTMIKEGAHGIVMVLIHFGEDGELQRYMEEAVDLLQKYCSAEKVTQAII